MVSWDIVLYAVFWGVALCSLVQTISEQPAALIFLLNEGGKYISDSMVS